MYILVKQVDMLIKMTVMVMKVVEMMVMVMMVMNIAVVVVAIVVLVLVLIILLLSLLLLVVVIVQGKNTHQQSYKTARAATLYHSIIYMIKTIGQQSGRLLPTHLSLRSKLAA